MQLPTLEEFLAIHESGKRPSYQRNQYVSEAGFDSLYVRYTKRVYQGYFVDPVLDIANVTVEEPLRGTGVFTRLIERLRNDRPNLTLYVESAQPRFYHMLLRYGFVAAGVDRSMCCFLLTNTKRGSTHDEPDLRKR